MKFSKKSDMYREQIIMMLPSFISQILLLMNSGSVFDDAFCRIAESYGHLEDRQKNEFTDIIYKIYERCRDTGESIPFMLLSYSRTTNVKEMIHVATLIAENVDKGTFLWERLAEVSDELWEERKRITLEKIRLAESKMSFPLGLLLMALLIVTVAPAMLQM